MRRNLLIAQALASSHLQPIILIVAGAREAGIFGMSRGVDCLTLPALYKDVNGDYRSRCLDVSLNELIALRAKTIQAALEAFEPDVFIVDKVPRGVVGELDPALDYLRRRRRTCCVLGIRDVLDDPATVQREWRLFSDAEAIREYYNTVWVYGDPTVYDVVREYHFPPDIAAMIQYTGYLGQPLQPDVMPIQEHGFDGSFGLPPGRLVLCLLGGGQDGSHLAEAFAEAELTAETNGLIVTGPFMPLHVQERLRCRAVERSRLRVITFMPDLATALEPAERVVAMGGYNTICELLSFGKAALIVPRVSPRREQLIRAERLRDLGLLDMVHPDKLCPQVLSEWLSHDVRPPSLKHQRIDLSGLQRLPGLLEELMTASSSNLQRQPHKRRIEHVAY